MQNELSILQQWSSINDMKLNASKCSIMQVSFCKEPLQLEPLTIDGTELKCVESVKILGLTVQNDLKWNKHITDLLKRCNKKLYMLRRLKSFHLPLCDLLTIFKGYVRPILEYGAPVFNGALTKHQVYSLQLIQKRACRIMLVRNYISYQLALERCDLLTLEKRRRKLCIEFAHSLEKSQFATKWLPKKQQTHHNLRNRRKYTQYKCKTNRFKNSPLPYLIDLLNNE